MFEIYFLSVCAIIPFVYHRAIILLNKWKACWTAAISCLCCSKINQLDVWKVIYTCFDLLCHCYPWIRLIEIIHEKGVWSKQVMRSPGKHCLVKAMCEQLLLWAPVDNLNTSLQWKTIAHEFYLHSCTVRQVFCLFTLYSVFLVGKLLDLWWVVIPAISRKFLSNLFK